jgi:delta1-piperideine-2-carboxylate reductase
MRISIPEARALLEAVMRHPGHTEAEAAIIADHLLDSELRGLRQGGLARAISICERMARTQSPRTPIRTEIETPVSVRIDGGDNVGYLVGRHATEVAIRKARGSGIAMVAANNTWYTGMLSYYAEMAVAQGLVTMIASNASAWVAPHGATQARFGTNPMCFGFPNTGTPVIWDIGTSVIIHADAMLARRLGQSIADGVAYDSEGRVTTDPAAALTGALINWGGPKGSGLGLVVQLLGIMSGSTTLPRDLERFGCLIVMIDPKVLAPGEDFAAKVAEYIDWVKSARPLDPKTPVRVPFERSAQDRARRLQEGFLEVPDVIHAGLMALVN